MKKLLTFIIFFSLSFVILHTISGSRFSIFEYVEYISLKCEDLETPKFPKLEYQSMGELTKFYTRYYFEWDNIEDFEITYDAECLFNSHKGLDCYGKHVNVVAIPCDCEKANDPYYCLYDNELQDELGYHYICFEHCDDYSWIDTPKMIYTIFNDDDFIDLCCDKMRSICTIEDEDDLNDIELFIFKFNGACRWFAQPLQFIVNLFSYFWSLITYLFSVITAIFGGLVI